MLTRLKAEFDREGIDSTQIPLTMDSWFVSEPLRKRLHRLGFAKIIIAGKSNYVFTIAGKKQEASQWKKDLVLHDPTWGIDVPSYRVQGYSPTFGSMTLFFFQKSTTRSYYLMNFSENAMRGAAIWHIWKQHHLIECFWKILKSIFHIRSMQLQGDGLYTALLIKVLGYLLALRLKAYPPFSKLTITHWNYQITDEVFTEYLHCKYKAYLILTGNVRKPSDYEQWLRRPEEEYTAAATRALLARDDASFMPSQTSITRENLTQGIPTVIGTHVEDESFAFAFHALQRVPGASSVGPFDYVPVLFVAPASR